MQKLNILVAGSTGYIGIELVKLLVKHKGVKIKYFNQTYLLKSKIEDFKDVFAGYF